MVGLRPFMLSQRKTLPTLTLKFPLNVSVKLEKAGAVRGESLVLCVCNYCRSD